MKIIATFVQFKHDPDAIELAHAWDEYCIDANLEGYEKSLDEELGRYGTDVVAHRTFEIVVPYTQITRAFETPQIAGEISPA